MSLKNKRHTRGISLIEAALVLPILLMVTFGLLEYGNLILRLQQIENVARQAARTAALDGATQAQVDSVISTMMANVKLDNSGYSKSTVLTTTKGGVVSVTIHVPYAKPGNISITNIPMLPIPAAIERTVVMAKEGP